MDTVRKLISVMFLKLTQPELLVKLVMMAFLRIHVPIVTKIQLEHHTATKNNLLISQYVFAP